MYIDQSAAELRLNVVGGPFDLAQFTLLRAGQVVGSALRVRAGIIGASHVLAVQHARLPELHEVFACCDPGPTPAPARRLYSGGACELACEPADGFAYRFSPQVSDLESGAKFLLALEERVREGRGERGQIGLAYTFPSSPEHAGAKTVVWVGVDPDEKAVRVETAHCYPNEGTIVFSETRIGVDR